ncbi:MAG: hypothetical protein Q3M30_01950 [Candidatus Electrothrix sp. Rat3]|nr:hypothetical protein [Candidatus Electrothrix rattekaaiensis]
MGSFFQKKSKDYFCPVEIMMLERIFLNLLDRIIRVQDGHKTSPGEETFTSRDWEFIFSDFDGWTVLHCSTQKAEGYWLYPMLLPSKVVDIFKKQLPAFSFHPPSTAYSHVTSKDRHWLEPCWGAFADFSNSEIPLFFDREYFGRPKGEEYYYEFNQLVTHPLNLHWNEKQNSYCRLNDSGEQVEIIKIINHKGIDLILMRRRSLEKILYLGDWFLIRYVSFIRSNTDWPDTDSFTSKVYEPQEYEAKFEFRKCKNDYIEFKGAHIERPTIPKEQLLSWCDNEVETEKKYAELIINDWRNNKILKGYSIDPKNFANYFTESELPYETSPIFFKAEILDKYKNNPDKYELQERTISCRGGWSLQTYDINKYNQVHTYAVYLARLPYKEQLHWLQYNEEPKGEISERAFQTDFAAQYSKASPLQQLKRSLKKLGETEVGNEKLIIWQPKGGSWETAAKGLHYVNSENANEWHDFIIALANTTNEGLLKKPLSKIAVGLGNTNKQMGTLGLLKFILINSGYESKVPAIHGVLNDLQIKRGKGKAHGAWQTPEGSLIDDATERIKNVTQAINDLQKVLESLHKNQERGQALPHTVRSLKGALKKDDLEEDDYKKYLEEKHL